MWNSSLEKAEVENTILKISNEVENQKYKIKLKKMKRSDVSSIGQQHYQFVFLFCPRLHMPNALSYM